MSEFEEEALNKESKTISITKKREQKNILYLSRP